jgi:tetratricopeptide (TPR) repeat protein
MAIRGSLSEAGLSDVLQLLALGQKTGCLSVARQGDFGSLYFDRGRVVHASLVNRRDRLGQALVRTGAVDEADVRAALAEQAGEPGTRLGEVLLRRGAIDRATLDRQVRVQIEDAVYTLLAWTEGTFSFEADVRPDPRDRIVSLDPGALLLEGARRADELTLIATEVQGSDAVFAGIAAPVDPAELTHEQQRVLPLLDGRRDVARLADDAGLGEFEVSRALFDLLRRGLARRIGRSAGPEARNATARLDEHRNLGLAFARAGMLDIAAREFRRVLELRPSDVHARLHLGLLALRDRRWADAAAILGEATALPSASAAVFHALGLARHRLGAHAEAEEAFDEAARRGLARDPRLTVARASLALARGDHAGAREHLEAGRDTQGEPPALAEWHHLAASLALAAGEHAAAEAALRAGVARFPDAAPLHACLAALLGAQGRHDDAHVHARRAAESDPELPQAQKALGDSAYRAGRLEEAADRYQQAVRLAPSLGAESWVRLGTLALRRGDRPAAVNAWERALTLQPEHPIARGNLEALLRAGAP